MDQKEPTKVPKNPAELGKLYPRQKSYSELYDERQAARQMVSERLRIKAPMLQLILRLYIIVLGGLFFASYIQYAFQSANISAIFFTFLIAIVVVGIAAYIHGSVQQIFQQLDQQELVFIVPYGVSLLLWLRPIAIWAGNNEALVVLYITILHACLALVILSIMRANAISPTWRWLLISFVCIVSLSVALFA